MPDLTCNVCGSPLNEDGRCPNQYRHENYPTPEQIKQRLAEVHAARDSGLPIGCKLSRKRNASFQVVEPPVEIVEVSAFTSRRQSTVGKV